MLRRLFGFLVLFAVVAECSISVGQAANPGPTIGTRISKSGTVHLADLETLRDSLRSIYLPAGKLVLVFKQTHRHRARQWNLALTEDGLYIYLRIDGVHYYNPSENAKMQSGTFAVVERPYVTTTEDGTELTLTPSEVYEVVERDDFEALIKIDNAKLPELGDTTFNLRFPEDVLAIFEAQDLLPNTPQPDPIRSKTVQGDLAAPGESIVDNGLSEETRDKVLSFLNRRLIASKTCEQTIEGSWEFDANATLNLSSMLSPLEAKFGGGGSFSSSFKYPVGIAFEIDRYSRRDPGGGEIVVEVKNETIRTRCGAADLRRRLIVSTSRRESADITAALLQNLDLDLSAQGFPILRCRDDYWKLYDEVTRRQTLRPDTAALFLAHYTRFTGGSHPADCR